MKQNKKFLVVQGKVKYPTWCPSGIVLKEVSGSREYPVDQWLGEKLVGKIGKEVEENFDFEVLERVIHDTYGNKKTALLCDKGEIAGGEYTHDGWVMRIIGDKKKYLAESLTPIQFAEIIQSPENVENLKWRQILKDFSEDFPEIKNSKDVVVWFRNTFE